MKVTKGSRKILKEAMSERGIGQKELAERMRVNQSTISTGLRRDRIGLGVFAKMLSEMEYDVAVIDRKTGEAVWIVDVTEDE